MSRARRFDNRAFGTRTGPGTSGEGGQPVDLRTLGTRTELGTSGARSTWISRGGEQTFGHAIRTLCVTFTDQLASYPSLICVQHQKSQTWMGRSSRSECSRLAIKLPFLGCFLRSVFLARSLAFSGHQNPHTCSMLHYVSHLTLDSCGQISFVTVAHAPRRHIQHVTSAATLRAEKSRSAAQLGSGCPAREFWDSRYSSVCSQTPQTTNQRNAVGALPIIVAVASVDFPFQGPRSRSPFVDAWSSGASLRPRSPAPVSSGAAHGHRQPS